MPNEHAVTLRFGEEKVTTTTKFRTLGQKGVTPDARVFYYAQAGATALTANTLVQAKVGIGANLNQTPSTAVGDWDSTEGNIPLGSVSIGVAWDTGKSSGEYTDGYMTVETTPGSGMYRIESDPDAGNSATATVIRLHPDDTVAVAALTTVSKLAFTNNPYASVIVVPATIQTGLVVGAVPTTIVAGSYFWLQTAGPAALRYNDLVAAVVGEEVLGGVGATAGDVVGSPKSTATAATADPSATVTGVDALASRPRIGYALEGIPGDGDLLKVMLTIRG